jgi:hypothetical protein
MPNKMTPVDHVETMVTVPTARDKMDRGFLVLCQKPGMDDVGDGVCSGFMVGGFLFLF